jgi:hypothetical protein
MRVPAALDPNLMTPVERIEEIGEILAAGLIRLRARQRQAEARPPRESSLDFAAERSVHGQTLLGRRKSHA